MTIEDFLTDARDNQPKADFQSERHLQRSYLLHELPARLQTATMNKARMCAL
jgi:hypothetical protein